MTLISKRSVPLAATAALITLAAPAPAAVISQSNLTNDSGGLNFGQRFEVSSAFFAEDQNLDSITFHKGVGGGGGATVYLDVYAIGTANISTLNFQNGTGTADLSYLGSSDNAVDYAAATGRESIPGDALTWTFSGITLPRDAALFAVFSSDAAAGGFLGASINIDNTGNTTGSGASLIHSNITNGLSDPLFGGGAASRSGEDNYYFINVTPVPEPGSLLLLGLGGAALLGRRRR